MAGKRRQGRIAAVLTACLRSTCVGPSRNRALAPITNSGQRRLCPRLPALLFARSTKSHLNPLSTHEAQTRANLIGYSPAVVSVPQEP